VGYCVAVYNSEQLAVLTEAYLDVVAQLRRESISLSKEALSNLARDIIAEGGRGALDRKQFILTAVLKARATTNLER
jgi:hypothetical protein